VTDVHFPAGSGKHLCVCPEGTQGDLCDREADECRGAPCAAGECVDAAGGGFRCECPAGLKGEILPHVFVEGRWGLRSWERLSVCSAGVTCLEDVNECEGTPCFPGVWCFNGYGTYGCGSCPRGMLGNGTVCTGKHERTKTAVQE